MSIQIDNWLFRSTILLVILTSGSLYAIVFGGVLASIFQLALTVLLFLKHFYYPKTGLKKFALYLVCVLSLLFIHFAITGFNNQDGEFLKLIIRIVSACLLLYIYALYERPVFPDLMWVFNLLAIHALLNFIVGFLVVNWISYIPLESIKIKTFHYLFFYEADMSVGGVMVFRNQGVFWEPGVLSVYLNIALFIQLFVYKSRKLLPWYLFLIVSTVSSTGLVISFLQIFVFYKAQILKNIKLLFVLMLFSVLLIPVIFFNLQEKIFGEDNSSFVLRSYDLLISFQIMMSHFFTGLGFGNEIYKMEQLKYSLFGDLELDDGRGNTNSIMTVLVSFGVPFGIYILHKLYRQTIVNSEHRVLFFTVIVLCLASEPLIFSAVFLLFIFSKDLYTSSEQTDTESSHYPLNQIENA